MTNERREQIIINDKEFFRLNISHYPKDMDKVMDGNVSKGFHRHHQLEIACVVSGQGAYDIEGQVYAFKQGDVFVFNNIESHVISHNSIEDLELMYVLFEPRFIWSSQMDTFDSSYLDMFFDRKATFSNKINGVSDTSRLIKVLMDCMLEEFNGNMIGYELTVKIKLLEMLVSLLRYYHKKDMIAKNTSTNEHLKIVNQVMDYIEDHLDRGIRIGDLAELAQMHPNYFSTVFKSYNGVSPKEYIQSKKIQRAIDYIKFTDKTILDVAMLCGFNNSTSFNKAFKNITGRTPSSYR